MQLLSIEDLAAYLGDSKRTIYKYIASGDCPPYMRISAKNIKFDRADVDAWLISKKIYPVSEYIKMSDIKSLNSAKDIIKNATIIYKLLWMPHAQAVLKQAEKQAHKDGFELMGTEHILFGILSVKDCLAATILNNLKMKTTNFDQKYEQLCKSSSEILADQKSLSDDIDKLIRNAYEQATEWGHTYIGTEHLLVGILKAEAGAGFQILMDLGITVEKVCEETAKLIVCRKVQNERKKK
jgi:excisionase family DNA binding protein